VKLGAGAAHSDAPRRLRIPMRVGTMLYRSCSCPMLDKASQPLLGFRTSFGKNGFLVVGSVMLFGCSSVVDAGRGAASAIDGATLTTFDPAPSHLVGEYRLAAIGGQSLPASFEGSEDETCNDGSALIRTTVVEGELAIAADGEMTVRSTMQFICGDSERPNIESIASSEKAFLREFDDSTGELRVRMSGMRFTTLLVEGGGQSINWLEAGMHWERGSEIPFADPAVEYAERAREAHRETVGPCEGHEQLQDLPIIAASDTAGIGARIEQDFPGWRLTTEKEIGCRALQNRFSMPPSSLHYGKWSSGDAWWVMRADLNGDGREDVLGLLSNVADPLKDILVVMHAGGDSHEIQSLGGSYHVGLSEPGTHWGCQYDPDRGLLTEGTVEIETPGFYITDNDTYGFGMVWHGGAYRSLEDVTGLGACH